jgi:hypothetical protein
MKLNQNVNDRPLKGCFSKEGSGLPDFINARRENKLQTNHTYIIY